MTKMNPCKTCPFLKSSKNYGSPEWLRDVLYLYQNKKTAHSCHVTDKNADGFVGGRRRDCDGIKMLKINDETGVHIHRSAFRNYKEFFNKQLQVWKLEGLIK